MSIFQRFIYCFLIFCACAGTCACLNFSTTPQKIAVNFLDYAPPVAGTQIFKHQISAQYNNGKDSGVYTGIVKWDARALTLIATSDLGRLCKIVLHADGNAEQTSAAFLPAEAKQNLHFALRDFQFIFYSVAQINASKNYRAAESVGKVESEELRVESFENSVPVNANKNLLKPTQPTEVSHSAPANSVPANSVPATFRSRQIFENGELLLTIEYVPADAPLAQQTIRVQCPKWRYNYTLTPLQ